jgi:hypothetical protein
VSRCNSDEIRLCDAFTVAAGILLCRPHGKRVPSRLHISEIGDDFSNHERGLALLTYRDRLANQLGKTIDLIQLRNRRPTDHLVSPYLAKASD